jgi:hypothetical protein
MDFPVAGQNWRNGASAFGADGPAKFAHGAALFAG